MLGSKKTYAQRSNKELITSGISSMPSLMSCISDFCCITNTRVPSFNRVNLPSFNSLVCSFYDCSTISLA